MTCQFQTQTKLIQSNEENRAKKKSTGTKKKEFKKSTRKIIQKKKKYKRIKASKFSKDYALITV